MDWKKDSKENGETVSKVRMLGSRCPFLKEANWGNNFVLLWLNDVHYLFSINKDVAPVLGCNLLRPGFHKFSPMKLHFFKNCDLLDTIRTLRPRFHGNGLGWNAKNCCVSTSCLHGNGISANPKTLKTFENALPNGIFLKCSFHCFLVNAKLAFSVKTLLCACSLNLQSV